MLIDFHIHLFPDALAPKVIPKLENFSSTRAFTNGTLAGLCASMQGAGVDLSVTQPVATSPAQVVSCNDFAAELNQTQANICSFGAMHPDFADYKAELKRIKDLGIKGIKLHPNYQATYFDDIRYQRIVAAASELDLIVLVHAGLDIGLPDPTYLTPQIAQSVIDAVQPQKLVLAHMGGWQMWDEAIDCLAGKNVYLDTAFCLGEIAYFEHLAPQERKYSQMKPALFAKMVAAFGADRILFASDSPWSSQAEDIACIRAMPIADVEKQKILGENAQTLLGIK